MARFTKMHSRKSLRSIGLLITKRENKLFICENLTPYTQSLAYVGREGVKKRAKKIHNSWSNKRIIKFRRTMNKRPIPVNHQSEMKALYPDFIFKERDRTS